MAGISFGEDIWSLEERRRKETDFSLCALIYFVNYVLGRVPIHMLNSKKKKISKVDGSGMLTPFSIWRNRLKDSK